MTKKKKNHYSEKKIYNVFSFHLLSKLQRYEEIPYEEQTKTFTYMTVSIYKRKTRERENNFMEGVVAGCHRHGFDRGRFPS